MATREQIETLVSAYVDAVGRQDLEATMALFATDAVQEDPLGTPPNEGADAIRGFFEKSYRASFSVEREGDVRIVNDHASFRFTIEVPTGGDSLVIRVADLVHVDKDGLIDHVWAVQDLGR